MNKTKIQWTDFTSNPIRYRNADGLNVWACVKVSDGCTNCYSETAALNPRMVAPGRALGAKFNAGEMAKLTPYLDEGELGQLLRSKTISGKRVFVGDMTDVFGPWVTDEMLDRLFAVFALRPDVTWQVLTKRPERMRAYVSIGNGCAGRPSRTRIAFAMDDMGHPAPAPCDLPWPLPNVWLGTSVEDQRAADTRISELLATLAAVRFLSCEPLLGPVELRRVSWALGETTHTGPCSDHGEPIHWVIAGGESGPGARPCDVAWLDSLRDQCAEAGIPFFFKQAGSANRCKHSPHGSHLDCQPLGLRVREYPGEQNR